MDITPLSELFTDEGVIVTAPSADASLAELERSEVTSLFERRGVVLFRGFDRTPEALLRFTDQYTESYAPDAARRAARFDQWQVRNVDAGADSIALHCEAAFAATFPEIVWFHCHTPPSADGETTLCDGVALWDALQPATRALFLAQPVKYEVAIQMRARAPDLAAVTRPWPFEMLGVSGHVDEAAARAHLVVVRSAVLESRLPASGPQRSNLAFANYILLGTAHDEIRRITMADGTPIPPDVYEELDEVASSLTYDHVWEAGDLLMIDNRRFQHGRRAYRQGDARDIVQVQTARAAFPFGATTRRALR